MSAQLRCELFKLRTTRTNRVVLLTAFGMLFAALLGALSITGEIRHGMIRPTFRVTPRCARVIFAKVAASALAGGAFGLLAAALAIGVGSAALAGRAIDIAPSASDVTQLLAGGAVAAALWGAIGVGVGAIVRDQVGAVVGLAAWMLFIEWTLIGTSASAAKYAPGPSAGSLAGAILQQTSTSPSARRAHERGLRRRNDRRRTDRHRTPRVWLMAGPRQRAPSPPVLDALARPAA